MRLVILITFASADDAGHPEAWQGAAVGLVLAALLVAIVRGFQRWRGL